MRFTGLGSVFKTCVKQGACVAKLSSSNRRIFAHCFVGDIFRKKQFGCARAGDIFRVVQFDEEVVEPMSVVEHRMKPNKLGEENG
jgi:hypothetical protein